MKSPIISSRCFYTVPLTPAGCGAPVKGRHSGLFIFKLFATCWGMLFKVFRLGYLRLSWVCLGFVLGAVERI